MNISIVSLVSFAALAACLSAPPVQARGVPLEPASLYESHSEILSNGHTPEQVAEYQREEQAKGDKSDELRDTGEDLLTEGHYAAAELDFRQALAVQPGNPWPYAGLAEALEAQGRTREALAAYRTLIFPAPNGVLSSASNEVRTQMGYAIALSQLGRWPEAVAVYEKALKDTTHFGDAPRINVHFDPGVPQPVQLQALAHVATGMQYTGSGLNKRAYVQFYQALSLDSDSPFTNYYYGYGWRSLDPTDQVRIMHTQQAKAALQKAVKIGNANVKAAALKALKSAG